MNGEAKRIHISDDEHEVVVRDDHNTIICPISDDRYSVFVKSGTLEHHCPGCGVFLDSRKENT